MAPTAGCSTSTDLGARLKGSPDIAARTAGTMLLVRKGMDVLGSGP